MPDKRRHRGPDPEDALLFAAAACPVLRQAASDLCWLLNRDYAVASSLELVGNRYALVRRQRTAVARCVCSDEAARRRQLHQLGPAEVLNQELWLDGYNVLNALEAALSGGVILLGRDGCYRDMAAVHGRYRLVEETIPALRLVGELTSSWSVSACRWWLDKPVSNSGRLKRVLEEMAAQAGWNWQVELVYNPDKVLSETDDVAATSDSAILDRCDRWINLARLAIDQRVPQAHVVDLAIDVPGLSTGGR
jgi:hypothetical protein